MKFKRFLSNISTKKLFSLLLMFIVSLVTISATVVFAVDMTENDGLYYADYSSFEDTEEAANALNVKIEEEGIILMKNNGLLPFEGVENITVLGKNSTNLAYGGGGSGGGNTADARTIQESLSAAGYNLNPKMEAFYATASGSRSVPGLWGGISVIGETPIEEYSRDVTESWLLYNDAAVIVITRSGSEGGDLARGDIIDCDSADTHYLELNQDELDLIELAKEYFSNIVVIINNSAAMELSVLENDPAIDAIVWVGHPGNSGIMALGEVLNGSVNPSGRTVDIYAEDFTLDPTWANFGDNSQADGEIQLLMETGVADDPLTDADESVTSIGSPSIMYEEGIYVGYRYYETRGFEEGGSWYEDNVVYPFGYGLSYTTFDWNIVGTSHVDGTTLGENDCIEIQVEVTNTGDVAGKDVVQLYYTAPYTVGGIEKSHVVLGDFAKTELIKPGKSDVVTLTLYVQDMASYDYNDANANTFEGYELEAGAYELKLMKNSHDVVDSLNYTVSTDVEYTTDRITGNLVVNQFDEGGTNPSLPESTSGLTMSLMSRADFAGTFPTTPTDADLTLDINSTLADEIGHVFSFDDIALSTSEPWYVASVPAGWDQVAEEVEDSARTITYLLKDMAGLDKDDPAWDTLMNELKYSELITLIGNGYYQTSGLDIIGKERDSNIDGPAGFGSNGIYWASETTISATWNLKIAQQMGQMIGNEALWIGASGWYAPAMNIHRSPFAGRNFEYYSEDGVLSGKMASAVTNGAQSKGLYVYLKHFAINDQETNRTGLITFADEQAMREIYLKAFQIPVQEANAKGVMSSFNHVGAKCAAQNYSLLTGVLRDEWGFDGLVVTDYYSGGGVTRAYMNLYEETIMGNDIPLGNQTSRYGGEWDETLGAVVYYPADDPATTEVDESLTPVEIPTWWYAARTAAKNVLYVAANSNSINNGVDFSALGGTVATELTQFVSGSASLLPDGFDFGTTNVKCELVGGELPDGLSISDAGAITGTANEAGTYNITVEFAAFDWVQSNPINYTLVVNPAFTFVGSDPLAAEVDVAFSSQLTSTVFVVNPDYATNHEGYGSITYADPNGTLPAGLTISSTGLIEGTPSEVGEFDATVVMNYTYRQYWGPWSWDAQGSREVPISFVITGEEIIIPAFDMNSIEIAFAEGNSGILVNQNVGLPQFIDGAIVFWESSNPSIITSAGLVNCPAEMTNVQLTATVLVDGEVFDTKMFNLTVMPAEAELTAEDVQAMIDDIDLLTEEEVQLLIDNIDLLTEEEVQALIDEVEVLTAEQVQALIDAVDVLSEEDVQALIDASSLSEEEVQALIDASIVDTGCSSGAIISPSFGIIGSFVLLAAGFIVYRRKF